MRTTGFKIFIGIGSGLMIWTACERPHRAMTTRWHGETPVPAVPFEIQNSSNATLVGPERIRLEKQSFEGIPIEGMFFKNIEREGKPVFLAYRWAPEMSFLLRNRIRRLQKQSGSVREKFWSRFPALRGLKTISEPRLTIQQMHPVRFSWKMKVEEKDGMLLELELSEDMKQFNIQSLGSHFVEASASLFPKGPLRSEITDVWLRNLLSLQSLESDKIWVRTESDQPALAEKNQFRFGGEDPRFSQVQAFYFVTESLDWFEKNFHLRLPFRVEVETQKGYPKKTNTAFYYQHKIRLGEGDEVTYSRIPLDPSIVIHESVHAVVEAIAGLPYEGEGGSLNEAMADYFTASQLENPRLGEASYRKDSFKRTLQNEGRRDQKNGGLYHDSLLVSGLLWDIRTKLGSAIADRLAWKTLRLLTPDSTFQIFQEELSRAVSEEDPENQKQIRNLIKNRGWS